jgi:biopolymer transport protein ExbB
MEHFVHMVISGLEKLGGGGALLIPLMFYSIWAHTLIMERAYHLRRERIIPSRFVTQSIYSELVRGNSEVAVRMCERRPGPLTNILRAGIERRDADEETLKRVIRLALHAEKPVLTRRVGQLGMLAAVAMYTGLLGTILGMIISFRELYTPGGQVGQSSLIASGISQALITTAAGLIVALPSYVAYHYFSNKVQGYLTELERHGMSLVRFLVAEEYKLFQDEFDEMQPLTQAEAN